MIRTDVFMDNGTQAVCLAKAVALDDDVRRVTIVAVGRVRVIAPAGWSLYSWFIDPVSDARLHG